MVFHGLLGEATGVDLEQVVCTVLGTFDESALIAAFGEVASRHAILRTRFGQDESGRPIQEVLETVEIPVERLDLTDLDSSERAQRFDTALRDDRARGIDLGHAPAMRLLIVSWSEDEHRVVWTFHHALLDGRSFPLVLREVFAFADAAAAGQELDLPVPRPYREYIEFLRGLDLDAAAVYWRGYLAGFTAPTSLVIDRATIDDELSTSVQGVSERRLSLETTTALREFAA
jgi:hypothetical protein